MKRGHRSTSKHAGSVVDAALEAMGADALRELVRGLLPWLDDKTHAKVTGQIIDRAARSKSDWSPEGPTDEGVAEVLEFAEAAQRVGYADSAEVDDYLRYHDSWCGGGDLLTMAARLETIYPDKILAYYRSGLGSLDQSATRETYARWANIVKKLRHMWIDVIKDPEQWDTFVRKVKQANLMRPAFQEEFAKAIPGWNEL